MLPTLSLFLLYDQATQLHCQVHVLNFLTSRIQSGEETDVGRQRFNHSSLSLSLFSELNKALLTQMNTTDEGFSFSFHKNYKLGPTYPWHAIFSLRELQQTSPSALRAETSSRYQSDPLRTKSDTKTKRLGLLSINFDFRNVIFQPMVFPFVWAKYK